MLLKRYTILFFCAFLFFSCNTEHESVRHERLYQANCASCHIAPKIEHLTKRIWRDHVLPEMGARMGIPNAKPNLLKGMSSLEIDLVLKTGIYTKKPMLSQEEWQELSDYIISLAPDTLKYTVPEVENGLKYFVERPVALDNQKGSFITYTEFDKKTKELSIGTMSGQLLNYDFIDDKVAIIGQFSSSVTDHVRIGEKRWVTLIGKLNPSEMVLGSIVSYANEEKKAIASELHRPVDMLLHDFDQDGVDEIVVCDFGHLTGDVSLLVKEDSLGYDKKLIFNMPGVIRAIAADMNKDGKDDIVILASQGREGVYILYQEENLSFRVEKAIGYSPVFGTSWFELVDYNDDGHVDIISVNGDNADYSYIHKPYHGLRIALNDGAGNFKETFFTPIIGATRVVARDFDLDGDIDFGVISTFPDYELAPEQSFVYLENINEKTFTFKFSTSIDSKSGRWMVMDAGDLDQDGDEEIILSSFSYSFTPVPKDLAKVWNGKDVDLLILENTTKVN